MTRIVFITRGRTTGLWKGGNLFLNSILCGVYGEVHHWVRLWEAKRSGDRVWFHLLEPYMTLVCAVYTMGIFYARLQYVACKIWRNGHILSCFRPPFSVADQSYGIALHTRILEGRLKGG
jgi:hypothetical protein